MNLTKLIEHPTGGTHPRYTQFARQEIGKFVDEFPGGQNAITGEEARLFLDGLAAKMKRFLKNNRGVNINDLFEFVG